jgi:hypothetical protein
MDPARTGVGPGSRGIIKHTTERHESAGIQGTEKSAHRAVQMAVPSMFFHSFAENAEKT